MLISNFLTDTMKSAGLFRIQDCAFEGNTIKAHVGICKTHWILGCHFPGKPIVPGALLVELLEELCSVALKRRLSVATIKNARFKRPLDALVDSVRVEVNISKQEDNLTAEANFFLTDTKEEAATAAAEAGSKADNKAASITAVLRYNGHDLCFIVPFYNNSKTVAGVIKSIQDFGYQVIAVNDGSTDGSCKEAREAFPYQLVSYDKNKGKGYAIRQGFKRAAECGFKYALVFDADGQHTLSGAESLIEKWKNFSEKDRYRSIVIGSRNRRGADSGGVFANNFSNFWLKVQTLRALQDTQSGMRLYPLNRIMKICFLGNRYEFETEVLVRMAWRGISLVEVPVDVIYPKDRVSHFRKRADFARISVMNTFLTIGALFYGYPRMLFERLFRK